MYYSESDRASSDLLVRKKTTLFFRVYIERGAGKQERFSFVFWPVEFVEYEWLLDIRSLVNNIRVFFFFTASARMMMDIKKYTQLYTVLKLSADIWAFIWEIPDIYIHVTILIDAQKRGSFWNLFPIYIKRSVWNKIENSSCGHLFSTSNIPFFFRARDIIYTHVPPYCSKQNSDFHQMLARSHIEK